MLEQEFARFAERLSYQELGDSTRHAAIRCLVDWFAAAIPGGIEAPARHLTAALGEELSRGSASLVPSGRLAPARAAALINGVAAHTVEVDDIFSDALYHPGAPVIAAALAAAQLRGARGSELITAIVAGYEISNRIGAAVNPSHYEFWHTTGTVGTFGATAAAARLLNLDVGDATNALANSATMAAGLQQAFRGDGMTKPLHAGRAAEGGVLAALAAAQGFTGAPNMLEGPFGFGAAMSGEVDWDRALEDLGERYTIERTTHKAYPACGHTFAPIDGILALRRENDLTADMVRHVRVLTYGKAIDVAGNPAPQTVVEAKFSIPYCVAVALADGRFGLDAVTEERLSDSDVKELMSRVSVERWADADKVFPHKRAARIGLLLADGRELEQFIPTRRGEPGNPLSDSDLAEKFHALAAPVLGGEAAERQLDLLWNIAGLETVGGLVVAASPTLHAGIERGEERHG